MSTTADGILLDWLRLVGWTVEIDREGDAWIGVARHVEAEGAEARVGGCATALTRLVWDLFIGAVERLEGRDEALRATLRAA